jgi:hypothetical protein
MRWVVVLGLAVVGLRGAGVEFQVTDERGKKASGVALEAGAPDADGWFPLKVVKAKGDVVLVWPLDGVARVPDGPEPIPAMVISRAGEKALATPHTVAVLAVPVVLGIETLATVAGRTGLPAEALGQAVGGLKTSADPFEKGVGLLYSNQPAVEPLAIALKQRQRQLTRVPSEIYAVALLYGRALYRENKFDDAAVAFLTAVKLRPSDPVARALRADALVKAGKGAAAEQ